jgi:hypothetical protein
VDVFFWCDVGRVFDDGKINFILPLSAPALADAHPSLPFLLPFVEFPIGSNRDAIMLDKMSMMIWPCSGVCGSIMISSRGAQHPSRLRTEGI